MFCREAICVEKYINRLVEMIYVDRANHFSKRVVKIHSIEGGMVRAFCYEKRAFRTFKQDNILAVLPVNRLVSYSRRSYPIHSVR